MKNKKVSLLGDGKKLCGCSGKCSCMDPITRKVKNNSNGTLLKNK